MTLVRPVGVWLKLDPEQAALSINGKRVQNGLRGGTFVGRFPRRDKSSRPLRVEAWADGYERYSELVNLDDDRIVEIKLHTIDLTEVPVATDLSGTKPAAGIRRTTQPEPEKVLERSPEKSPPHTDTAPGKRDLGIVPATKRRLQQENPYGVRR